MAATLKRFPPLVLVVFLQLPVVAVAQSVCLPAPRLLTTMPMGGQAGTSVEVTISGDNIEDAEVLSFSHPGITAVHKTDDNGLPVANRYVVSIAADCPAGVHEARVMTRLGVSTSRAFSVGSLTEVSRTAANTSLDKAMPLTINSVCNAAMTRQAVDYFTFEAHEGQRVIVDCAARGIDSKLKPVVIIADATGADLLVERRGGSLDFTAEQAGTYVIKVHELTYNGGPHYFYRLVLREGGGDQPRHPSTRSVSSFSWPPPAIPSDADQAEAEPNNLAANAQKITLPCDISGAFFPAADVDTYEFTAKKGDVWWVEVASERLGLPTDPSVVVQLVEQRDGQEALTDVVELSDIPSPVKVSSNGYSYDGPPYNAGSTDVLGKVEIPKDGRYRLQIRDLFGGTRNDSNNVYRLIVRQARPDFSLVAWALHMNLRNGDRNALSKPIALRGGATMPLEVVVVRRDGFDGPIDLKLENLPPGVRAEGLRIPKGKSRGIVLVTADADAPRGLTSARFTGSAVIAEESVTRECRLASMAWPVPNAWSEIPSPRLLADVPVSVCGSEQAPITIAAAEDRVWEVTAGEKLTVPLVATRRMDFSGNTMSLKTFGESFERNAAFDLSLSADKSQVELDLAKLKPAPGEYVVAFYGSAVAKYRYNPAAVVLAEAAMKKAEESAAAIADEVTNLSSAASTAPQEQKPDILKAVENAKTRHKSAQAAVKAARSRFTTATNRAKPKDIVDIVVSEPITIRVRPAEKK